jgi:hypothetical protein
MNNREPDLTGFKNLSGLVPAATRQPLRYVIPKQARRKNCLITFDLSNYITMKFLITALQTFCCIFFLQTAASANNEIIVAKNGATSYSIIIPLQATHSDSVAAALLQEYVHKISGVQLVITTNGTTAKNKFLISSSDNRLGADGFKYFTSRRNLVFTGGTGKGVIYGVVDFLEKYMGCRKFSVDAEFTPKKTTIALPQKINVQDKPVNNFRIVYGKFAKDEAYKNWQRQNTVDDMFADGFYVHTLGKLIPRDKYFAEHPEYFALVNGKRSVDQQCLSNSDVLKITIETLREEMKKQPGKKVWSVSQNDNYSYCHCDDCTKIMNEEGGPSGVIIRFVNEVAKQFPDKIISTLAYQYSRQAPLHIKPLPNVQIMLCTIELSRSLPIEEDSTSKGFVKDIVDWGKISNHIYLWDYEVNFSHHVSPFPNIHTLQPNLQFFCRHSAYEHFQQCNTDMGHEFSELKSYLIARLLWNPGINADSVITEFMTGYYGKAGSYIKAYNSLMEQAVAKYKVRLDIYEPPANHSEDFLSEEYIRQYNQLFDEAEAAVETDTVLLQRVKTARLPLQYATMEIAKNDMFGERGWFELYNGDYTVKPLMKKMADDFFATCQRNHVTTLSEAGLTPVNYYNGILHLLDVKIKNNKAFRKPVNAIPLPDPKYLKGKVAVLTDGVQGGSDCRTQWLGWQGKDIELILDLEKQDTIHSIQLGALNDPSSWIILPKVVQIMISDDAVSWKSVETITDTAAHVALIKNFLYKPGSPVEGRYIKFNISGTLTLPAWHAYAGNPSWVFLDEITVE